MAVDSSMEEQSSYPRSMAGVGSSHSLSMREKSQIKRRVNKEHNSNFRAGYININEEYLHKTGIRGRKRYLLYCFVATLVIVATINALITAWLVYKFRIYHIGMMPLEFYGEQNLLRFMEDADIDLVNMDNARVGGRFSKDLNIISNDATMLLGAKNMKGAKLKLKGKDVTLKSGNFTIVDSKSGKTLLVTGDEKMQIPLKRAKNLHALSVQVGKLKSADGYQDIVFESHKQIKILGAEGVKIRTEKMVTIEPHGSVILNATGGKVIFETDGRIFLNQSLPHPTPLSRIDQSLVTYKLCVCGNNGRLFRVPVQGPGSGCHALNEQTNPCDS